MASSFTIQTNSPTRSFTVEQGGESRSFEVNTGVGPSGKTPDTTLFLRFPTIPENPLWFEGGVAKFEDGYASFIP